jgi:putative FmdB family regulatory protein
MPVYEYACAGCGAATDRLLPHDRADEPGPCPSCAGELRRRYSRVAVRLDGWGFSSTDALVPERPGGRGDFRALRERAERLSDGDG